MSIPTGQSHASTGQETLSLAVPIGQLTNAAFALKGKLIVTSSLRELRVWDVRPWTPELRAQFRARGYLTVHRDRSDSLEELQIYIRSDKTISDMVRDQALDWAELFWKNRVLERD